MRFQNKIVLITGASSGIGETAAHSFAREGARLFLVARRVDRGEAVAESIRAAGGEATFYQADMADRQQIQAMVEECVATYGGLDIAVNNAGIEGATFTPTHEYPADAWDDQLAVNLSGVWFCMRHQIPEMLKRGAGSIINVSSLAGLKGFAGSSGYAATKFGVVGITKAAALEYATEGIRVNAVCPAVVESEMADRVFFTDRDEEFHAEIKASHPMNRIGKSEEVANAILWMASDEASFITGTTLNIDGGAGA